ncbi:hypothetical protein GJ633_03930 [Halorubrum sp. CBA1125]|uniref:hypothetical protein n=1 Tax=Halorubrum sp. CBA1125 TaxID=2668072 RepID=UPI0012E78E20|nr:hypothetical protein [Halorubrum sp. CBA1125]MUW13900.1 hypothetical protein [Halorubrum sp. CBA1125]
MRRRALLASAAAVSTASLAGCPTPPWGEVPENVDGADVTFHREYDGEPPGPDNGPMDAAELRRHLDEAPPRLVVAGWILDGARRCFRAALLEAALEEGILRLRIEAEAEPDWEGDGCPDVAQTHPYSVTVAFSEAPVPDRVGVRHGDETVLDETV